MTQSINCLNTGILELKHRFPRSRKNKITVKDDLTITVFTSCPFQQLERHVLLETSST